MHGSWFNRRTNQIVFVFFTNPKFAAIGIKLFHIGTNRLENVDAGMQKLPFAVFRQNEFKLRVRY